MHQSNVGHSLRHVVQFCLPVHLSAASLVTFDYRALSKCNGQEKWKYDAGQNARLCFRALRWSCSICFMHRAPKIAPSTPDRMHICTHACTPARVAQPALIWRTREETAILRIEPDKAPRERPLNLLVPDETRAREKKTADAKRKNRNLHLARGTPCRSNKKHFGIREKPRFMNEDLI